MNNILITVFIYGALVISAICYVSASGDEYM